MTPGLNLYNGQKGPPTLEDDQRWQRLPCGFPLLYQRCARRSPRRAGTAPGGLRESSAQPPPVISLAASNSGSCPGKAAVGT